MRSRIVDLTRILIAVSVLFLMLEGLDRLYHQIDAPARYGDNRSLITGMEEADCNPPAIPPHTGSMYVFDEFEFRTWGIQYDRKCGTRFLFIGSKSIGWGTGVWADETFPYTFYKAFKERRPGAMFEVINGNRPGYEIPATMTLLKDHFDSRVRPDVVIFGIYLLSWSNYGQTTGDTVAERVFSTKPHGIGEEGVPSFRGGQVSRWEIAHSELWYDLAHDSFLMNRLLTYLDMKIDSLTDVAMRREGNDSQGPSAAYLYDLHTFLSSRGVDLVTVILPGNPGAGGGDVRLNAALGRVQQDLDIPVLSAESDGVIPQDTVTRFSDGHYTRDAHKLIGSAIAEWFDRILDDRLRLKRKGTRSGPP